MEQFLPDLGIAIHNGDVFPDPELTISLTAYALSGCPVRCNIDSVEICHEVLGCTGSFILPVDLDVLMETILNSGLICFKIIEVTDVVEAYSGEMFRPIVCEIVKAT